MTENNEVESSYSADKLLIGFARSRFIACLVIAVAIHGVLIVATSGPYIRDQLDPEGAERRKAEALALQQAANTSHVASVSSATATQTQAVVTSAVPAAAVTNEGATPPATEQSVGDVRTNTVIMKQITEKPKPGEIPTAPDDLGISIDDTNPD